MTALPDAILIAGLLALAITAIARPWIALVVLLGLLPFNGWLTNVLATDLALTDPSRTLLAAWHDALVVGILMAAVLAWLQARPRTVTKFEIAAAGLLLSGLVSLAISDHLRTALYAYRTLFEPIVLAAALPVLARTRGLTEVVPRRAALAIVGAGVVAASFAFWQVYVGGIPYLHRYFADANGQLASAYLASLISQPRAIGTFNSPNEFGAYLVVAIGLIAVPGTLRASATVKGWIGAVLGLALLLSLSRSAWVGLIVMALAAIVVSRTAQPGRSGSGRGSSRLPKPKELLPPLVTFVVLAGAIIVSSGAPRFFEATLAGRDPSSASRVETVQHFLSDLLGLGPGSQAPPTIPAPTPGSPATPVPGPSGSDQLGPGPGSQAPPTIPAPTPGSPATPVPGPSGSDQLGPGPGSQAPPTIPAPTPGSPATPVPGPSGSDQLGPGPGSQAPPTIPAPTPGSPATPVPGPSATSEVGGSSSLRSRIGLFGIGLGMAGPKSDRFGEIPPGDWITSETWYVDFILQAGIVGFVALVTLVLIVTRGLWLRRRRPLARSAFSIAAGLAIGAIFIPVIDEPAVAIPLWSVIGLALAQATAPRASSSPGVHPSG